MHYPGPKKVIRKIIAIIFNSLEYKAVFMTDYSYISPSYWHRVSGWCR